MKRELDINLILSALRSVLPAGNKDIELHEPHFGGNEWEYVKECLDTGWVSSAGKFVDRFERDLAEFTGAKCAVAVVNGTAALHTCLRLVGVKQDDEVLVPALTFVATANAVHYCGAIPHFVDCDVKTLGIDPDKLDLYLKDIASVSSDCCINRHTGRRIKAAVPMHTFGHPVDLDKMLDVCGRYRIEMVEDAAESIGSYYKGRHTGNWGRVAALSFNGNKTITTGGGGAILTNEEALGKIAKHVTTTARVAHRWAITHDEVGYNYRLPNINAALGCAQIEQLPGFLEKKRALAMKYQKAFEKIKGVIFMREPENSRSNYWLNALLLDDEFAFERDRLLNATHAEGIKTRPTWTLMFKLRMYNANPRMDLSHAESIESRLISLPSSPFLA
jgi:perosamine synthetase